MLCCIIIEDEQPAQRILQKYIESTPSLELAKTFSNVLAAKDFLRQKEIDLIFLDIHLPKVSGLEFLKSSANLPEVILTTAYSEYALESYDYTVVDYLLKPISFERFNQAISKLHHVLSNKTKKSKKTIIFKSGHEFIQLNLADIICIKSDADYTEVKTNEKVYLSKESLKDWLKKLDSSMFCQIHKSYIINIAHFKKISGNTVFMNTITLPIGRVYKKSFVSNYLT